MKTVNSLSGGKTSSYIAKHYPADYNVFALVRTDDKNCIYPDTKVRQLVSDKIGKEFIGTLEDDVIINTMLDLEQFIGKKIHWVSGKTFDEVLNASYNNLLPSALRRYCTTEMKMQPIFEWWLENINEPSLFNIGFRANEMSRAKKIKEKYNDNGFLEFRHIIGKSKNGRNKWKSTEWQRQQHPLIEDGIVKDTIEEYWKDKPVRFAWMNNCVGCFHKQPTLLNKMATKHPNKLEWFASKERNRKQKWDKFRIDGTTYDKIISYNFQSELFDDDFNECDSGYCGL